MDNKDYSKVTRLEVIDDSGRVYVQTQADITVSMQDDGRTMKIFVKRIGDKDA